MPLQDLTPQLRTRLNRLERLVGWFVTVATVLLLFGFAYYVREMAKRKGWFLTKAPYFTYLHSAAGLKVGDPVKLMGFDAGEITQITAEAPDKPYDVYVELVIKQPYYGYVWDDSMVKVKSAGLLGNRFLEITKGGASGTTNQLAATYHDKHGELTEIYSDQLGTYTNYTKGTKYYLLADEPPELGAQMDQIVQTAKGALPGILALTNQLQRALGNAATASARLDDLLVEARPLVTNLTAISANLRDPRGSLGEWLMPTNVNQQLTGTLASAHLTLNTAQTNLNLLSSNFNLSLENLANLTSNLNAQVQGNSLILTEISELILHTDEMVQGLKRHWLLRSSFGNQPTNTPFESVVKPRIGGAK